MKKRSETICLIVAVLVIAAGQGFGVVEFKDGGTWDIDYTINDDVLVDYLAPGMQTTVNLLNGGNISNSYQLQGYSDSRINISGGIVSNRFSTFDSIQVTMSSGYVGFLTAYDSSQVTMSGGWVATYLSAYDSSQVTMYGGEAGRLRAEGNSQINWSGGTIVEDLVLHELATLTIDGFDFAVDGSLVGFGEITSIFGGSHGDEPLRHLTGTLANGDIINNQFRIGNDAKIVLIPEPATLLLLGLGAVILRKHKKRNNPPT